MEQKKELKSVYSTFDRTVFSRSIEDMVNTNSDVLGKPSYWNYEKPSFSKSYTRDDIRRIIESGGLSEKQSLSASYYETSHLYRRLILHYSTLFTYTGILIPEVKSDSNLEASFIQKSYDKALQIIKNMRIPIFLENCANKMLIYGAYYGLIKEAGKGGFTVIDLPINYCRSRFTDKNRNDIVEFNVSYFNTFSNENERLEALATYPSYIIDSYDSYIKGKIDPWVLLPGEVGIYFSLDDINPIFLEVIPSLEDYDETVEVDKQRDIEEIKKIIVQKVPHLSDGSLLFEPPEAQSMHSGAVGMMKQNPNVSVLTTYADVDAITSKTGNNVNTNTLEKMQENVFYKSGTSGQLFGSNSNLALEYSIGNDAALMGIFINKASNFITNLINRICSKTNISFNYIILPITCHNREKFIENSFKLASSGYSFILPALALGMAQDDLVNIKKLENKVLGLDKLLKPLASSYTQSGKPESDDKGGAPVKPLKDKKEKTIDNKKSIDKTGGSK